MSLAGALAGGFVGTVVMTILLETAAELRLTRVDVAYLVGTLATARRVPARALGYVGHFAIGLGFAAAYWRGMHALGRDGWLVGAAFGAAHGLVAAAVLVPVALPLLHPRLALGLRRSGGAAIEPPGPLSLNYGPWTPAVLLVSYAAYGTLVGGFASLPG